MPSLAEGALIYITVATDVLFNLVAEAVFAYEPLA
jgi:hypothetical protein